MCKSNSMIQHNGYLLSKRWFQTPLKPCLLQMCMCWCRGHIFFYVYMNHTCRYITQNTMVEKSGYKYIKSVSSKNHRWRSAVLNIWQKWLAYLATFDISTASCVAIWLIGSWKLDVRPCRRDAFSASERALQWHTTC